MISCEFDIWEKRIPVVSISGDPDFGLWLLGVPLADVGSALGESVPEPEAPSTAVPWPETLPPPKIRSRLTKMFGGEVSLMDSGRARVRPTPLLRYDLLDVEWCFTQDEYDVFKTFFSVTLENGAESFLIDIYGTQEERAFAQSNYKIARSDNQVSVAASLQHISTP